MTIIPDGTVSKREKVETDLPELVPSKLGPATLTDLAKDYVFVNHGGFVIASSAKVDPVQSYCAINKIEQQPILLFSDNFQQFDGINKIWNRAVLVIPKSYWPDLERCIDQTTVVRRDTSDYYQPVKQRLPILDFIRMGRYEGLPDKLPMVEAVVYGADGNKACWHFKPINRLPFIKYKFVKDEPIKHTVELARMFLTDNIEGFVGGNNEGSNSDAEGVGR